MNGRVLKAARSRSKSTWRKWRTWRPSREAEPRPGAAGTWLKLRRRVARSACVGLALVAAAATFGSAAYAGSPPEGDLCAGAAVELRTVDSPAAPLPAAPLLIDGEKLAFDVYYNSIPAGHASLEVSSEATPEGSVYRITSSAQSNDVVSAFYEVDDQAVTDLDATTFEMRRSEKHIREGSSSKHISVSYGPTGTARSGEETFHVDPGTTDILSALYFVRGQNLQVGEDLIVGTFDNGKCYRARVRVIGREKVSTHHGSYDCIVVAPQLEEGFFAKTGKLLIYLTDDALKLPVLLRSKVKVGSFVAELVGSNQDGGQR
jgi:hypothetical protein